MSKKLTPWFPPEVRPVRKGYYQRDWNKDGHPAVEFLNDYWTGSGWRNVYCHQPMARVFESHQNLPWRGLAKKP